MRVVTNPNLAEARMLPRSRDISSVTKPSSGALRRWASGTDRVLRGRLGKIVLTRRSANVPETADAADVSDAVAREGLVALPAVPRPRAGVGAVVIDWQRAA